MYYILTLTDTAQLVEVDQRDVEFEIHYSVDYNPSDEDYEIEVEKVLADDELLNNAYHISVNKRIYDLIALTYESELIEHYTQYNNDIRVGI